jgi:hypothetical protein
MAVDFAAITTSAQDLTWNDGTSCLLEVDSLSLPYLKYFQGIYRYQTSGVCKLASVLEDNSSIVNNLMLALNVASIIDEPRKVGEYWLSASYSSTEYVGDMIINGIVKRIPHINIILSRTAPMCKRLSEADRAKAMSLLDDLQSSLVTLRLPKNSKHSSIEMIDGMIDETNDTF